MELILIVGVGVMSVMIIAAACGGIGGNSK